MRVQVLGAFRLTGCGGPVPVPDGLVGDLFRRLLVVPGEVLAVDALCDALWPGADRGVACRRLQVVVSRLRRFLDGAADDSGTLAVERSDAGYRLVAAPAGAIDRLEFESIAERVLSERLPELVEHALALWEGEPYTGFELSPEVQHARRTLLARRREVVEAKLVLIDAQGSLPASRRAKLRRPVLATDGLVARHELLDATPAAGSGGVIVVTAPAGYGKSVLLSLWASRQPVPVAWVGVDDSDNDPTLFWAGVVGALVESGHRDLEAVNSGALRPGSQAFLSALGEVVRQSANPLALAFDDVHLLTNALVLEQLSAFLLAVPESSAVGFASRSPVDFIDGTRFPLGALRRVGADQLRFSLDEVASLTGGSPEADRLWKLTEGWPIAVAALRSAGRMDTFDMVLVDLSMDVIDQILANAPTGVARLLLRVAVLDGFSVELCEHLTPGEGAGDAIAWLRAHQLVTQAGSSGAWFRLHNLFARELRRRAEADPTIDPRELSWRAAEWFLREGIVEDALRYAIASGDAERIALAASQVLLDSALSQEFLVCTGWLAAIDPGHLEGDVRGHSIATGLAALWSRHDVRRRWGDSRRRRFGGADDVILAFYDGAAALHEGRSSEAVEGFERVAAGAKSYAAPYGPDLGVIFEWLARSKLIEAKMFQDSLRADDQLISEVVSRMRGLAPAVATYTLPFWSLTAFAEGEYELATDLSYHYFESRRLHDPGRPATLENSLPGALAAAQRASSDAELRALAYGIEDLVDWHTRLGMFTGAALTHLVVAALYSGAGDHAAARSHQRRQKQLLATMPDVPFLERFASCAGEIVAARAPSGRGLLGQLTEREQEVLRWLATDLTVDEIARMLHLNRGTVSNRISTIYRKLSVRSRHSALLKIGVENLELPAGVVPPNSSAT